MVETQVTSHLYFTKSAAALYEHEGASSRPTKLSSGLTISESRRLVDLVIERGPIKDLVQVPIPSPPPPWFSGVVRSLNRCLSLPEDWDSYGARRVDPEIAASALIFLLTRLAGLIPIAPSVCPINSGGAQFEWHTNGIDLEIAFVSPIEFEVYFNDGKIEKEWKQDDREPLDRLYELIGSLTQD